MQAKLTEWNYVDSTGTPISFAEAEERWGLEHLWMHVHANGERLTAAGRQLLESPMIEPDELLHLRMKETDRVLDQVRAEIGHAVEKFPKFASHHEGYAILLEEVDELWDEVKANNHTKAKAEAIQVAAMAVRFITDLEG